MPETLFTEAEDAFKSWVLKGFGKASDFEQLEHVAALRRLGDLTDPERVADANMLAAWREKYRRKITVRTKSVWGRRLRWTG